MYTCCVLGANLKRIDGDVELLVVPLQIALLVAAGALVAAAAAARSEGARCAQAHNADHEQNKQEADSHDNNRRHRTTWPM